LFFVETGTQAFQTTEAPLPGDTLQVQYEVEGGDVVAFPLVVASGIDPGRP
jgi:hypothetical protein